MRARDLVALALSIAALAGAAVESASIEAPADASQYHAAVRACTSSLKIMIGDWVGRDVEMPMDAVDLLRPNVAINREFTNTLSGDQVLVQFVQCGDARDIVAHYPPRCYVLSRGMEQLAAQSRDWQVGDLAIAGTEYEFRGSNFSMNDAVVVQNFVMLPDGRICRDMEQVKSQVSQRERYYGAAQIQLAFNASMSAESRDAALVELAAAFRPLIDVVLRGKKADR